MSLSILRSMGSNGDDTGAMILGRGPEFWAWIVILGLLALCAISFFGTGAFAQAQLPGTDASDKLEAAGTLLRIIDTALFKWAARIFAGLCLLSTAWSLKEQRIGIAIICIVAAILFGSAPTWVKNIFSIASADSVFG